MSTSSFRVLVGSTCLWASVLAGCGGDGARPLGGGGNGTGLWAGSDAAAGSDGGTGGVTGSGGISGGTGGVFGGGSGGVAASGGTTGTGGVFAATGGNSATGGRNAGSGGVGSGGRSATTGGVSGTGGNMGSGGVIGSGGTGGPNPTTCNQLAVNYENELPNAKVCTFGLGLPQCQTRVGSSLGCGGGCTTYVQDATKLNEIKSKWNANGCDSLIRVCPAIACLAPQSGNCSLSPANRTGQCHDGSVLTTD